MTRESQPSAEGGEPAGENSAPAAAGGAAKKRAQSAGAKQAAAPTAKPGAAADADGESGKPARGRKGAAAADADAAAPKRRSSRASSAPAPAGGGQRSRGRPARDSTALLRAGLKELSTAHAGSKFFTSDWKNVKRNWENYIADVVQSQATEEDPTVLQELETLEKQALAAKTLLQKISVSGMSSRDTLDCYSGQKNYLEKAILGRSRSELASLQSGSMFRVFGLFSFELFPGPLALRSSADSSPIGAALFLKGSD